MSPITRKEALGLMEGSSRFFPSLLVSKVMTVLAGIFREDEDEWRLVGLLHDLDYDQVRDDKHRHGITAAEMLKGRLPERSLHAIMAHDHRTGIEPSTLLDESLILADSLAILMEDQALTASVRESTFDRALQDESRMKPWISGYIQTYCNRRNVTVLQILEKL